jgi:ABC-type maltose transport system permease subunit
LLLALLMVVQMVSSIVLLVPIYSVVDALRPLDSHLGLVPVYVGIQPRSRSRC